MSEDTEAPAARKFTVKDFVETHQLKKDMGYSLADLSTAMQEQASLFVHYGVLASKAGKQVDDLKMLLEIVEAKVSRKVRDEAASNGTKLTEGQIGAMVSVHPQVIEAKKALNEAKQIEANAKIAVEGFRHRRDMLVQHGLISREEMKGEVSINRRNAAESELDAMKARFLNKAKGDAA